MIKLGLYAGLEAKPGKEKEIEELLIKAKTLVDSEPETIAWFALKEGPSKFGVFDVFDDEKGREAHLNGEAAKLLKSKAELFVKAPEIYNVELIAVKKPEIGNEKKVA